MPDSLLTAVSHPDRVFPTLTPAQIARVARHGRRRPMASGEVLVEVGQRPVPFFVVSNGEVQALRPSGETETLFTTLGAGQFTGEGTMLPGRRALMRLRAITRGEVIELAREQLLGLIQTDTELSEIFMRAFILRRIELIASGYGDVVLIGSTHCAGTLSVREFLTRNGHPFHYIDLDRDADAQDLLDRFHVTAADVPVLICRGDTVLRNPGLHGIVLGGADWVTAAADGTRELDLRVTLETDDGALIHMTFTGVRDDAAHYFRTLPRFETAAPKCAFLTRLVAVGIGEGHRDGPVHTIEEIL
jgi:hypothetical protein